MDAISYSGPVGNAGAAVPCLGAKHARSDDFHAVSRRASYSVCRLRSGIPGCTASGSTIADISQRMLDGISTTDLSTATICKPSQRRTGQFQGTQGFRQYSRRGTRRTRPSCGCSSASITTRSLPSRPTKPPYLRPISSPSHRPVAAIKAQGRVLGNAAQAGSSGTRTAIKPIVANVAVVFKLAGRFRMKPCVVCNSGFLAIHTGSKASTTDCRCIAD